jgi:hypothetical protein
MTTICAVCVAALPTVGGPVAGFDDGWVVAAAAAAAGVVIVIIILVVMLILSLIVAMPMIMGMSMVLMVLVMRMGDTLDMLVHGLIKEGPCNAL